MQGDASVTELSKNNSHKSLDVLDKLINDIDSKGLELLGMKSFYFNKETLAEYSSYVDHLKIDLKKNKPVIVLAVSGHDVYHTMKKLIGSDDIKYAKKNQINSLNSTFYNRNEDTIVFSSEKIQSKKMLQYFFGGRLEKIHTVERLQEINEEK